MQKFYMLLMAATISAVPVLAQHEVECFTSITSDFPSNTTTTLYAGTPYRLEGCIHVPAGSTLIVQAGAVVMGEKASNGTLIVDKDAQFISQGTSTNPCIFTSDQEPSWRRPGDWGGIAVLGKAPNNQGNSITLTTNRACSITGGGTASNDNSGVFKYMRIEYPRYGLAMVSVGNGTEFHDMEVLYASENSLELYGGSMDFKRFVSYNAKRSDILATHGNLSKGQYILGLRVDPSAYVTTGDLSNGIIFANNDDAMSNYASSMGAANNHPVFSNVTLVGPSYCEEEVNGNFKNGVLYYHNTEGGIYNSIIAGWPVGFRMEDFAIDNANVNFTLNFAENTFFGNAVDYATSTTWIGTCAATFTVWMNGSGFNNACKQRHNQFGSTEVGLGSSLCDNLCETYPTFTLNTSAEGFDLTEPDYSADDLDDEFFDQAAFRGAFDDETDWVSGWGVFCGSTNYCSELRSGRTTGIGSLNVASNGLVIAPNPVSGIAYATFNNEQAGTLTVSVTNSVGQLVRSASYELAKGKQRIAINTEGLAGGIYTVSIARDGSSLYHSSISVR